MTSETDKARLARLECLQAEVRKREDQFLLEGGDYVRNDSGWEAWRSGPAELNEAAIAEWADSLLQAQKAEMLAVLEEELAAR